MQENNQNSDTLFLTSKDPNGFMTDFVSRTNQRYSLPKHLVLENRFFQGDRITLRFGGLTLNISGKNLLPIYKAIKNQKIIVMREGCPDRENEENFQTWIDSIEITKPNRSGGFDKVFPS